MAIIEVHWNPTQRQIRQFATATLVALPLAAWILCGRPWSTAWESGDRWLVAGSAIVAALFVLLGWTAPKLIKPVYQAAVLLALPMGIVVSELVMLIMYFLVFTPLACVFRLAGRDPLDLAVRREAESYWEPKAPAAAAEAYFRQS